MGKTKKHKIRHVSKYNPLSLNLQDSYLVNLGNAVEDDGPVEAVRKQLQSANVEEKLNGLHALAVFVENKDKVAEICRSDVVRIASALLCEKEIAVRSAAAGALRNLSTYGTDVCEFLVQQDILTPLLALLREYAQDTHWTPSFDSSMHGQIDLHSDVFLHAINLLWNLCEISSLALETFNQSELLEGLMRCLDYKVFGLDITISFAQCLLVVSENNPKSWHILNQHVSVLIYLLSVSGQHGHSYIRTLSAGILANVPALAAAHAVAILRALNITIEENLLEMCSTNLTAQQHNDHKVELDINMDTVDEETDEDAALRRRRLELPTNAEIAARDVGYLLDAQRVATEVITNLCSVEEEEWEDADDDDDELSESEIIVEYEQNSKSNSNSNLFDEDKMPVAVLETIKSIKLIDNLWKKSQPLPNQLIQLLRETDIGLVSKANNLRISSLLCLQNLCNALSVDDLGGPLAIYNVWVDLCQQVLQEPHDATMLEPLTSLMRSALERVKTNKQLFSKMTKNDLEMILRGINTTGLTNVAELRANWLRMLGTLACLLPEEFVKMIVPYIVSSCGQEEDVWTISEGLDALMDVFSDNDWSQMVLDLNLVQSVKELEKIFKTKLRQQKRELKERYPAVQTVNENFSRFVKYIEKGTQHDK